MKFIVKDEPAGWAVSVWVMDDRPNGWLLMVADSVVNGEIIWRWEPVTEAQELPVPTFRFNWDFVEELANAILKRVPKRIDDEVLKSLEHERSRVDKFIDFLTHKNLTSYAQENFPAPTPIPFEPDYALPDPPKPVKPNMMIKTANEIIGEVYGVAKATPGDFAKAVDEEIKSTMDSLKAGKLDISESPTALENLAGVVTEAMLTEAVNKLEQESHAKWDNQKIHQKLASQYSLKNLETMGFVVVKEEG